MATYNDILILVNGNKSQGDAICSIGGRVSPGLTTNSGVIYRGPVISYDSYVSGISGHLRTQIFVISGSGL